jgi:protein ImuB
MVVSYGFSSVQGIMRVLCLVGTWDERGAESVGREMLALVPRVAVEPLVQRIWADMNGLREAEVARAVLALGEETSKDVVRAGVADTPVGAYAGALAAESGQVVHVDRGQDRAYLAERDLMVLEPEETLTTLLEGVGVERCGMLAALEREAVEVRFGADALNLWRRSRAEDSRVLFREGLREVAQASLDFIDYVVTDPERLVFTANALLGGLCEGLQGRGVHARRLELTLPLANGETWRRTLTASRPTASRTAWLRLVRGVLERLTVADAVAGLGLVVQATESAAAVQGDLFDAGFATASAVEAALARLVETHGPVIVRPEMNAHPLAERRSTFVEMETNEWMGDERGARADPGAVSTAADGTPAFHGLTLQLLPQPRPIAVETTDRRDHVLPVRYRDGEWKTLTTVAGPDRISGGQWESPYARAYYRGLSSDGRLVWLYHDARSDGWFLHGWWD